MLTTRPPMRLDSILIAKVLQLILIRVTRLNLCSAQQSPVSVSLLSACNVISALNLLQFTLNSVSENSINVLRQYQF
jgi:hypothetical protein